jgi:Polysaccharide pyruvyl transferase
LRKKGKIALVAGFWGQNIGNAFFNIGGKRILEEVFPEHSVEFIQDQPGYWTFNFRRNPKNDIGLLKYLRADYLVLQGPILSKAFRSLWPETMAALTRKGTKVILLSASLFRYTEEEIYSARQMLKEFPPFIISTRDQKTYEVVIDCCDRSYSGIDSAFFVSDVYEPFQLDLSPYITINFDRLPEPDIYLSTSRDLNISSFENYFEALDYHWYLKFPKLQKKLSLRGKVESYIGALFDLRRLPSKLGSFSIIRPEHRFNPHIGMKIYRQPNALVSDEPFTYFTVYGGTSLTLSDRVHACVVTLSYGKPAMLFSPSPRTYLFDRIGLSDIRNKPMSLEKEYLEKEKRAQVNFLKKAVASE